MKRHWLMVPVAALGLALAACSAGPRYGYMAPPPPPPRAGGAIGFAPAPGYVWIDGYWDLRGSSWYWMSGRWALPPRPHAVWVPGRWRQENHRWRWHEGRWR